MFCQNCNVEITARPYIEVTLMSAPSNARVSERLRLTHCRLHSFTCLRRWMREMKQDVNELPREIARAVEQVA